MKARFDMTYNLYCCKKSKQNDNEDDCYIIRVIEKDKKDEKDKNIELVGPLNQFVVPPPREFKYVSEYVQQTCNDQAMNCRH